MTRWILGACLLAGTQFAIGCDAGGKGLFNTDGLVASQEVPDDEEESPDDTTTPTENMDESEPDPDLADVIGSVARAEYNHLASTTTLSWLLTDEDERSTSVSIHQGLSPNFVASADTRIATLSPPFPSIYEIHHEDAPTNYLYYRLEIEIGGDTVVTPALQTSGLYLLQHVFGDGATNNVEYGGVAQDDLGRYWVQFNDSDYFESTRTTEHIVIFDEFFEPVTSIYFVAEEEILSEGEGPPIIVGGDYSPGIYYIDDFGDYIFVNGYDTSEVLVFDLSMNPVTTITYGLQGPGAVAQDGDGSYWIANYDDDTLIHLDGNLEPIGVVTTATDVSTGNSTGSLSPANEPGNLILFQYNEEGTSPVIINISGNRVGHFEEGAFGPYQTYVGRKLADGRIVVAETTETDGGSEQAYLRIYSSAYELVDRVPMPYIANLDIFVQPVAMDLTQEGGFVLGTWNGIAVVVGP